MNNLTLLAIKLASGEEVPNMLFWPILILFATMFLCLFLIYLKNKVSQQTGKAMIFSAMLVCIAAAIVCLALIGKYYNDNIKNDDYYSSFFKTAPLYVTAVILIGVMIALTFVLGRHTTFEFDSRSVAFAAVCIAMSFGLSYIRVFKLPQGGSVTLASLLPIMVFSYIFGIKKGFLVGIIYGVLQAIQDPYIIHPAQFILDYPVAFSAIAFAGVFADMKAFEKAPQVAFMLGAILTGVFRYIAHFCSGAFAFGAYAGEAGYTNVYLYSLAYNSFVFVDILVVIVIGVILFSSPAFMKEIIYRQRNRIQPVLGQAKTLEYKEDEHTVEVTSHAKEFDLLPKENDKKDKSDKNN